jgi:hypothetical protein
MHHVAAVGQGHSAGQKACGDEDGPIRAIAGCYSHLPMPVKVLVSQVIVDYRRRRIASPAS